MCVVDFQDNFRPEFDILWEELLEKVDSIVSILLIEIISPLILQLLLNIVQHTKQQLLIQTEVLPCHVEF